jgi:hypothetical protein
MSGGIIQLVAYGNENLFLTQDPQITFFKIIYRRHTNFSREEIPQCFINEPNFGKRSTCRISQDSGDMIDKMTLKITLPSIPKLCQSESNDTNNTNNVLKFAWIRKIGFAMLKYVEIEINDKVIDKHYGEWLYIWAYLTTKNIDDHGLKKMIGDVPELTDFTESKEEYILYVPLYFWFCRTSGLALPMICLQFSDIKINVEFYDLDKCCIISPTHYIKCTENIVNYLPYEYLCQKGFDGVERYGIFSYYDSINRRLYYTSINCDRLIGIPYDGDLTILNETKKHTIISTLKADKYVIKGISSEFTVKPDLNVKSVSVHRKSLKNIKLKDCHVLTDFVFLDDDERMKFAHTKHDYLIEQLYYTPNVQINSTNPKIRLDIDQPCKLMVWLTQLDYISDFNDRFNYTDSHILKRYYDPYINHHCINDPIKIKMYDAIKLNEEVGSSLIDEETIRLNSQVRLSCRPNAYFEYIQPNQYAHNPLPKGSGMYSYGVIPFTPAPSGTTNMSQIDLIELNLKMNYRINTTRKAKFRSYALCYNVWRVDSGLSGQIFVK